MTSPSSDFVQSFARGLMVIRSFDASAPSQTLSQVAAQPACPARQPDAFCTLWLKKAMP